MEHKYLYETHLHTKESSACASCEGSRYPAYYKKQGYTAIIVTDHFFNGNCAVPWELPWEEKVRRFCLGYENAKEAGRNIGLDVFFGWEANYCGAEFLIYGLEKEWLKAHPEIMDWSIQEQFAYVQEAGGCVVQAHPFREREYTARIQLYPEYVNAVEVQNSGNEPYQNTLAFLYAKRFGLPMTAGSDIHHETIPNLGLMGVTFDKKIASSKEYAAFLKSGSGWQITPQVDRNQKEMLLVKHPIDCFSKRVKKAISLKELLRENSLS